MHAQFNIVTNTINVSKDLDFINYVKEIFLKKQPELDINALQWPDYEKKGIRLIEICATINDPRGYNWFENRTWTIKDTLFDECNYPNNKTKENGKWDMTEDGDFLCHRWHGNTYFIYKVEKLHENELKWYLGNNTNNEETTIRQTLKPILSEMLIQKMMHFDRVFTGEFESKYGIHFKLILRGEHQRMRYKPTHNNVEWIKYGTLGWGSYHGWALTTDLKIACCRVDYDVYYNFIIEVLDDEQKEFYKNILNHNKIYDL